MVSVNKLALSWGDASQGKQIQPTESYSSCFLVLLLCLQLRVAQPIPSLAPVLILHSGMKEWKGQFQRKEVINHKPFLSVIL